MSSSSRLAYFATGFAMFSMFFGAGNVIFPLVLGASSGSHVLPVLVGLVLTGILLPLLGLLSMMLYDGHYRPFFSRIGALPGFFVIILIMALIGPFAGIPRTITLSYTTLELTFPGIPFIGFNLIFCAVTFLCAYRRDAVVNILGYWLTPALLILLLVMLVVGFINLPVFPYTVVPVAQNLQQFLMGAEMGYNTMDVLAALVFATVVVAGVKAELNHEHARDTPHNVLRHACKASAVAGVLLLIVYGGLCILAAAYHQNLHDQPIDHLLALLSLEIFGPQASLLVNGVVILACLTTAIALLTVFADFLNRAILKDKNHYVHWLIVTTIIAFVMSFLGFEKIVTLIFPILQVCYPFIIVLALCNIAHKLWGVKYVKIPVLITFILTLIFYASSYA
ncbi:MAG TPA: branched-chain amino acid transport system II carrier protein [Gammaproteobacteria bacterium]|nr:branched-chain amino acid transport system II carrier protein [Gammaproteobacteria bacterium]